MNTKWRTAALIKSELQVFVNFVCSYSASYGFVLKEQKLLDAAASNKKYTWKPKASTSTVALASFPTSDFELKNIENIRLIFFVFVL